MMRSGLLILGLLSLALVPGPVAAEPPAVNQTCPVMSGKIASPDHAIEFRGRRVHFCCDRCSEQFQANPSHYLSELPQFAAATPPPSNPVPATSDLLTHASSVLDGPAPYLVLGLAVMLGLLLVLRRRRASPLRGLVHALVYPGLLLLLGLSAVLVRQQFTLEQQVADLKQELQQRGKESKSYQDMLDFTMQQARAGLPNRIRCSFYRGNDERHPGLIYGGNYRTATFHLSLHTSDPREVNFGDDLRGQALLLRLGIERAPFTADGFYDDATMNSVALTRTGPALRREPVDDARPLTVLQKGQRWEATYPLGVVTEDGLVQPRGLVYLCLGERREGRLVPSQCHYWIQHELYFKDGKLEPESNLWMGPVYTPQPMRGPRLREWFSQEPIPVLPQKNTDDPKLLGLDVHRAP